MSVLRYRPAAALAAVLALILQTLALVVLATAPARAAVPLGLKAGDLVISDTGHQRVIVHPADGGPDRVLASGLDSPEDLVVTRTGDVIVADSGRAKIVKIPADGGDPVDLNPFQGAWGVTHLALDGAGGVLFSGTGWGGIGRVPVAGGNITLHVYQPPYPNYAGLGVTSDDDIVAVDCCDSSTTRMESDGSDQRPVAELTYDSSLDPSEVQPRNMSGLVVTPDDRLIVADTWNDLIWEIDGSGGRTSYGTGLAAPASVALGLDNAVYVADSANDRVVRISPDRSTQTDVLVSPDLVHPSGVAVVPISPEEVGDAFVGTASGAVERVRGSETVAIATGLDPVADVVVRDDGRVVVAAGDRLVEMSGDGSTSAELASFAHPVQALALAPGGDLLAAVDDGSGGTEVRLVSADGSSAQFDASPIYAFTALTVDDLSETYAAFGIGFGTSIVVRTSTGTPLGAFGLVSGLASEPSGSFLVADAPSGTLQRIGTDATTRTLASGITGPTRLARDLDGDILVAASGADELLAVPEEGGTPTTVATIADPVGVAVYVPRPSLPAIGDLPGTGNVGTAYDGYDFDATDNGGGTVTYRAIGDLPPGLSIDPATGELSGTPTATGDYTFRVQAANQARGAVTDELEIEVGKRLQSLTFTSTVPTHAIPDDTYTPAVSSDGSSNPVTISIDPTSSTVCSYDSVTGKVTFLIGGLCTILADQAGDADHEDAATAHQDVYVDKLAQTVSFTSTAPTGAKVGGTYTPAATGGPSANDVTFAITGNLIPPSFSSYPCSYDSVTGVVTFEHPGTCRVGATKGGDDRYWSSSRSQNITVGAGQLQFISTKPAPGRVGGSYTPAVNAPDASYWIDGGDGVVCSYDSSTGEVSFLAPGQCEVVAGISTSDYSPTSLQETITVAKQAQEIAFTTLAPGSAPIDSVYTPAATGGGSGNAVTFSIAPSSAGICLLDSGDVRFDHAGTCVIQADQAGDAAYEPAETATQTIQVARNPGSVDITSPPATGVVGQRYTVTATTTSGGGPVQVAVTSPGFCHTDGGDVVLDHAGSCDLEVSWTGDADHEAAEASQTIAVSAAPTVVDLDVRGRAIVATVSVVAPGAGQPVGVVEFSDGTTLLGTADLSEGVSGAMTAVMVREQADVGGQHQITARYVGSADFAGSQDAIAWLDPAITYAVTSRVGPTAAGWYHAPVTVTFQCTPGTAPILEDCPGPVLLDGNRRAGQSITREVVARDGTTARVVVTGIRIDLTGPRVRVRGAKPGHTYPAPRKLRCVARDRWSGVDTCTVKTKRRQGGQVIAYRAIAFDRAGNKTVVRGKYRLR